MSERPTGTGRADYLAWRQATTRWADDDVYGHMNNARYFELIDTAVNAHLAEATGRRHPLAARDRRGRRGRAAATSARSATPARSTWAWWSTRSAPPR